MIDFRINKPIAEIARFLGDTLDQWFLHKWTAKGRPAYEIVPTEVYDAGDHWEIGWANDWKVYPHGPGTFRYLDRYQPPGRIAYFREALVRWGAEIIK